MMTWLLPMMLVFFTLNLPAGVGVYWVVSTVFSLFASYYVYGRRILSWRQLLPMPLEPEAPAPAAARKNAREEIEAEATEPETDEPESPDKQEARTRDGKRRGKRKKRR
jgi:YidC/Oxa1 family membrane protein insertase